MPAISRMSRPEKYPGSEQVAYRHALPRPMLQGVAVKHQNLGKIDTAGTTCHEVVINASYQGLLNASYSADRESRALNGSSAAIKGFGVVDYAMQACTSLQVCS